MAQLKDTVVSGSLRATDSLLTTILQTKIIKVPHTAGGTDYGTGTNKYVLLSDGSSAYWGTATLITEVGTISAGIWQGTTVAIGYGGTGTNTAPTANGIIYAASASAYASTAAGSDGYILIGKGASTAPTWQEILPISHGGTGTKTAPTANGIIYASSTTTYASTAAGTDGYILIGKGASTAPTWQEILPITHGGTGTKTAPTQWGIIYASATTSYASTDAGTAGYLFMSNASSAPSWVDWRKHIFANKNESRNTLTVENSSWNVTSGTDLFGLKFKDTGLTYTPEGGSATASSDTGDWRAWLTCASTTNTVELNMRIDGSWQAGKFIGPLQGNVTGNCSGSSGSCTGNAATADKWSSKRKLTIGDTGKDVDGSGAVSWTKAEILGSSTSANFYRGDQTWSNTLTGSFTCNSRIYAKEWIQFDNYTGLYSPKNTAHFYPNNATSYGQWCLQGAKGGYSGIQFGASTSYMTVMDQGTYKGLFQEGKEWIFCYRSDVGRVGIGNSTCSYKLHVSGDIYANGGWLRTSGSCGWYSESHGGGWYMDDDTYVKVHNNKRIYTNNNIHCAAFVGITSGILQSSAGNKLAVQTDGNFVFYTASGGVAWYTTSSSSYRVKDNIRNIYKEELRNFDKLRVVHFTYKPELNLADKKPQYGLIAEEVQLLYPNLVNVPENYDPEKFDIKKGLSQPYLSIDYEKFVPLLIKKAQLQQEEITELRLKISALEKQLNSYNSNNNL